MIPKYDVRVFKTTTLTGRPMAALSDEIAEMMMMPVHDELVFEVPAGSVDAIRAAVEATMVAAAVGVLGTSIPVVVKTSVSQTWSDE